VLQCWEYISFPNSALVNSRESNGREKLRII
jgi:hypothetical protein